jgi:hypothetical protein
MARAPGPPRTLNSRNNLANAYPEAGRTAEAIPLHEQTWSWSRCADDASTKPGYATTGNVATYLPSKCRRSTKKSV